MFALSIKVITTKKLQGCPNVVANGQCDGLLMFTIVSPATSHVMLLTNK